jgi:hypothetical protein
MRSWLASIGNAWFIIGMIRLIDVYLPPTPTVAEAVILIVCVCGVGMSLQFAGDK